MENLDLQPLDIQPQQTAQNTAATPTQSGAPLDIQPLDSSKSNDFGAQMNRGLYQHLPFGKRLVKTGDTILGTHAAQDIESTPEASGFAGNAGKVVGDILGYTPAIAGAALAAPESALVAGSLAFGGQVGQEKLNEGASGPEALKEAAVAGGSNYVGGKALEGLEKTLAPLFRGTQGHGDIYRNLLNPGKGTVTDVEIKSGKDINDAFQKMAEERLPIKSVVQNNRDTVDTTEARAQLKGKISSLDDSLTKYLKNSDATFDLDSLQKQVTDKLRPVFKNDKDYESAVADVQSEFDAVKRQRLATMAPGQDFFVPNTVDAATLNDIKKGMWQKGYNLLAPTAQKTARIIGGTLKQAIEDAHPDDTFIKDTNDESGLLQTADGILQKAHGKVVNGGALGNYLRGGVGAIVGEQIGALLGHPVIGTGVGGFMGEQANRLLNNPELVTSALSKIRDIHEFGGSVKNAAQGMVDRFGPGLKGAPSEAVDGAVTPEIVGGQGITYQPKIGNNRALPGPRSAGQSSGPVINQPGYVPPGLPNEYAPRRGVIRPEENIGLPGPRQAGQSSGPVIKPEVQPGQVTKLIGVDKPGRTSPRYSSTDPTLDTQGRPLVNETGIQLPGATQRATEDLSVAPKTASSNGPQKPNERATVDLSKRGTPQGLPEGQSAEEVSGNTSKAQKKPLGPDLKGNKGSAFVGGSNPQTKTPEFKKWFGESKVIDDSGKPITVYHGTDSAFNSFSNSKLGKSTGALSANSGHWFVDNPDVAKSYADYAGQVAPVKKILDQAEKYADVGNWKMHDKLQMRAEAIEKEISDTYHGRGQNIIPAYLKMEKPFVMDAKGERFVDISDNINAAIKEAKRAGNDGMIIKNLDDDAGFSDRPATHYLVFNPTHIKSSIGNSGKFDPTKKNITMGMLGPTAAAGAAIGAAMGAKNAKAQEPKNRLLLPAAQYTKQEEGFSPTIYQDTTGHNTIGYGFNVDDPAIKSMIPPDVKNGLRDLTTKEADRIFAKAFNKAQNDAVRFVGNRSWNDLSAKQQKALTDMSYNLGFSKLSGFKKMKIAIQAGKYDKAAGEVVDSEYGRELPGRAHRNAQLIKG